MSEFSVGDTIIYYRPISIAHFANEQYICFVSKEKSLASVGIILQQKRNPLIAEYEKLNNDFIKNSFKGVLIENIKHTRAILTEKTNVELLQKEV